MSGEVGGQKWASKLDDSGQTMQIEEWKVDQREMEQFSEPSNYIGALDSQ